MSYKGYRQPHDPGVEFGPDAVVVDGDWLELEFVRRDEQVAALQAQLDAVREAWWSGAENGDHGVIYTDDVEQAMDRIWHALASAPSDVLDRVKREAKAEALEEAAEVWPHSWPPAETLRARAAAIRSQATK